MKQFDDLKIGQYVEITILSEECYNLPVGAIVKGIVTGKEYGCVINLDRMNNQPGCQGDIREFPCFNYAYIYEGLATMEVFDKEKNENIKESK